VGGEVRREQLVLASARDGGVLDARLFRRKVLSSAKGKRGPFHDAERNVNLRRRAFSPRKDAYVREKGVGTEKEGRGLVASRPTKLRSQGTGGLRERTESGKEGRKAFLFLEGRTRVES